MLYRLSSLNELSILPTAQLKSIGNELAVRLKLWDQEYGLQRNSEETGGYVLLAETAADLEEAKAIINFDTHPCEFAEFVGMSRDYVLATYQLNNDYGIDLYMPLSIVPDIIKEEL